MSNTQPVAPATPQASSVAFANQTLQQYPKVAQQQPAVASAMIQSGSDATNTAVGGVATVAPIVNALQTHQQTYNSSGWWNTILKDTKDVAGAVVGGITKAPIIGTVAKWAYKPLQEVQKDYKFIHSMWADNGPVAGILATLGVVAGGTIGSLLGPEGTVIGADIGGALDRNILGRVTPNYNASYVKSNDPNYLVSFGRDLDHGLSNIPGFGALSDTNHGFGQVVSGIADASFDFTADPLGKFGKMYSDLKKGSNLAEAKNPDGTVMRDESGLPIIKATLPIASRFPAVESFLKTTAPQVQTSDQLMAAYANPFNWQFRSAVKDIAQTDNPIDIQLKYNTRSSNAGITTPMANALAKANSEKQVLDVLGQTMYSHEFAQAVTPTGALTLPVNTLGKMFSSSFGAERIRSSMQASTLNDEKNFLLPKKSTIMEPQMEPVKDANGNAVINPDGSAQMKQSTNDFGIPTLTPKVDANGELLTRINKPVWASNPRQLPENMMNALAAKVRTFTGQKALSMNQDLMKWTGEKIDFSDPNAGKTVYDLLNYSMPSNVAKEYAAKVMTAGSDNERRALLRAAQVELVKAAGLPADAGVLNKILSQVHRATFGDEVTNGVYGFLDGKPLGNMEDASGNAVNAALDPSQRYLGSMVDLKSLHMAMRATKAYGILYNHADDFFTHYTNTIFAPLTLLSTGFGLRVSGAEALHQIIREGLGNYIKNVVSVASAKHGYARLTKDELSKTADAVTQGLTPEDLAVADKPNAMVSSNAVTKDLAEREKGYKGLVTNALRASGSKASYNSAIQSVVDLKNRVHPVGWVSDKFTSAKIAPYAVQDKIDGLVRLHRSVGSDGIPAGIASDHGASADSAALDNIDYMTQAFGHSKKPGEELAGLTPMDPHFKMYWAQNLQKAANSPFSKDIAKDYLRLKANNPTMDETNLWAKVQALHTARLSDVTKYQDLRGTMDGLSQATPESFAREQVAQVHGIVKGADGTIHNQFLSNIKNGNKTFSDDMKNIPNEAWPVNVLGRKARPLMDNALRRVEEVGYHTFVNPVMDFVSRQPLFAHFYTQELKDADTMKAMGLISEDQAVQLAALRGTTKMLPTIHDPALRSQFAVLHRNLMPFWFAQEQAMKRVGRLVTSNPQAFRDFQIVNQGMNNPGFVHTDSNGKKYIVYPLAGEFGDAALRGLQAMGMSSFSGLPESVTGNTASLMTVLPELKTPGTGVFANVAINQLAAKFPLFTGLANAASGGYPSATIMSALLPNSAIRDIWQGMTMDQRESNVYNSLYSSIAAAYYNGAIPSDYASLPAFQQQAIMDKIENNARSNLYIKGLLAFFLPLSPSVSNDHYTKDLQSFRDEYLQMLKPTAQGGGGLNLAQALAKFTTEHGSGAVSYTIGHTNQGLNGANIPLSDATMSWVKQNQNLMDNYGNGAAYLVPQSTAGGNVAKIENKMIALGFRSRRTPQDFMNAIYVSKGWSDISKDYTDYSNFMKQAKASGSTYQMGQASQVWKAFTANYGLQNPIWYDDYTSKTRVVNSIKAIADLTKIQDAGRMPTDAQGSAVNSLLTDYRTLKPILDSNHINGKPNNTYYTLIDAWNTYLDEKLGTNPSLSNVINGVFRKAVQPI
jgi:hypothetical protein